MKQLLAINWGEQFWIKPGQGISDPDQFQSIGGLNLILSFPTHGGIDGARYSLAASPQAFNALHAADTGVNLIQSAFS